MLRQGSFAADVALTRAAGVRGIAVAADTVHAVGVDEVGRILEGEGVVVSSYLGAGIILNGDNRTQSLDEIARHLEAAAELGAPAALVITGGIGGLDVPNADTICREWLAGAAERAASSGIRIMLEPIHPLMRHLSYVHTLEHGFALVGEIDNAGIVLDVGHLWWERDVNALIRDHIDDIVSVQLTNVDAAALAQFRYERTQLDRGDIPVASLVQLLESCGYRGWYEYEVLARTRRDERLDLLRSARQWLEREVGTAS